MKLKVTKGVSYDITRNQGIHCGDTFISYLKKQIVPFIKNENFDKFFKKYPEMKRVLIVFGAKITKKTIRCTTGRRMHMIFLFRLLRYVNAERKYEVIQKMDELIVKFKLNKFKAIAIAHTMNRTASMDLICNTRGTPSIYTRNRTSMHALVPVISQKIFDKLINSDLKKDVNSCFSNHKMAIGMEKINLKIKKALEEGKYKLAIKIYNENEEQWF